MTEPNITALLPLILFSLLPLGIGAAISPWPATAPSSWLSAYLRSQSLEVETTRVATDHLQPEEVPSTWCSGSCFWCWHSSCG